MSRRFVRKGRRGTRIHQVICQAAAVLLGGSNGSDMTAMIPQYRRGSPYRRRHRRDKSR
jgi:hypothetical protein